MGLPLHYPYQYEPISAESIIERYNAIIDESQIEVYGNYTNYLYLNGLNEATLRYIPVERSMQIYVNGFFYEDNGLYYSFDTNKRLFKWLFTKDKGGFDIAESDRVLALYSINYEDNGLTGIDDIVEQPTI